MELGLQPPLGLRENAREPPRRGPPAQCRRSSNAFAIAATLRAMGAAGDPVGALSRDVGVVRRQLARVKRENHTLELAWCWHMRDFDSDARLSTNWNRPPSARELLVAGDADTRPLRF
jgi:hypothetical protein